MFFCLFSFNVHALEFNTDVLDAEDKKNIDFSRFSQAGYILPGTYQMQVTLNGSALGNDMPISFYPRGNLFPAGKGDKTMPMPEACLPVDMVDRLGLTEGAQQAVKSWHQGQCADLSALKGTQVRGDIANSVLSINMPQAWLEYTDASWLPPSRWDNGIPGLLFDYNANVSANQSHGDSEHQDASVSGTIGANAGAWRLRADYQGSYAHDSNRLSRSEHDFNFSRVYLYRALPSLRSVMTLGENYINSNLFESWRYTGANLASDERMLPPNLRGYAPEIIGVANTNARVTVTQQGRVIYDSTVPAGPFRIQSLDSAISGQLDVKVQEQDGRVQTFSVSTASVPYLTRSGQLRYQVTSGRPSTWHHNVEGPAFINEEASWGISNTWSVYGGNILSDTYQALALGVGRDLFQLGAIALDVTQSRARFPHRDNEQGKSWRLSYSKHFDEANADITFAGYRFSEKHYLSMQQYLDRRYRDDYNYNQQKERYQINLYKRFEAAGHPFSAGLNYEYQTYWDRGTTGQYSANAGTWFDIPAWGLRNVSVNATAVRSRYYDRNNDALNLTVSIPWRTGTTSWSSSYSDKHFGQNVGYYDQIGDLDNYSLNAGLDQKQGHSARSNFNGMYTHHGELATVTANAGISEGSYTSVGFGANGGLTVTAKGAALHAGGYNGSTRLMVDTDGIAGVPIDNGRVVTNPWGIGVVTNVNSYYLTTAQVDVNKTADDVEATRSVVETALTDGAIGYRRFEVLKGKRLFAILRLANGHYPPFGASIRDAKGKELGIVGDKGLSWLSGITPGAVLDVAWEGKAQCHTSIPNEITGTQLLLPCR